MLRFIVALLALCGFAGSAYAQPYYDKPNYDGSYYGKPDGGYLGDRFNQGGCSPGYYRPAPSEPCSLPPRGYVPQSNYGGYQGYGRYPNYGYRQNYGYYPDRGGYSYPRSDSGYRYGQSVSCSGDYVFDGSRCVLATGYRARSDSYGNNIDQGGTGYRLEPRDRGHPANQNYTPYNYGSGRTGYDNGYRQPRYDDRQYRTVERDRARNGSDERRTVERRQFREERRRSRDRN